MRDAALVLIVVGIVAWPLLALFRVPVAVKLHRLAVRVVGSDASKTRLRVAALAPPFAIAVAYTAFVLLALR